MSIIKTAGVFSLLWNISYGFLFFSSGHSLEQYNVDHSQISVSGISSGAAMATQMHVIYSKTFMGVGMIAGPPFACSEANIGWALTACMTTPSLLSAAVLESTTTAGAAVGNIDATSNMAHDKVFILNGKSDTTIDPGVGKVDQAFYEHFVRDPGNVMTVFDLNSVHTMPTDNYGGPCDQDAEPTHYMSNCNYSAAFHLLNHMYGGHLRRPTRATTLGGKLMMFSQEDFFYVTTPGMYSMDTQGYIYIPTGCLDKSQKCKLHVAFHGCKMGRQLIGEAFVRHGGYNEVGELNNIIILYPQAIPSTVPFNPKGCWDWWGYTGALFATNSGFQPTALKRMINRVTG